MPVTESPARIPGWTLMRNPDTKSVRYRAPDGSEVGAWAYNTTYKHYQKTGEALHSPLGTRWQHYSNSGGFSSRNQPNKDESPSKIHVPVTEDDELVLELPEPKLTPASKSRSGLFTARELSDGFSAVFVILTSIMAMALALPEAQMTPTELKAISIPLGNIIERSKYNKSIGSVIVGKTDWFTLGYALFMYTERVSTSARERKAQKNAQPAGLTQQNAQPGPAAGGSNGSYNGYAGVPLHPSPAGLRGFTPNV